MILEARNITKYFGNVDAPTKVLSNVSFSLNYGEMLYIVGPSGSGKTTLLSILSGMLRPSTGKVIFKTKDIWQFDEDQLANFRLNSIGFVFQDFHLFPKISVKENVAIPLILKKIPWSNAIEQAKRALAIMKLENKIELTANQLSIGEQQRVAIARAIVTHPELLIFDEPTASLDGATGKQIISFIKNTILTKQHAIIIVTHDTRIYDFATRIIKLEDGILTEQRGNLSDY